MDKERFKQSITHLNIRHIWAVITLITVTCALTFYFKDGYYELGEEKYRIYMRLVRWMLPVWILFAASHFLITRKERSGQHIRTELASTEWFLILMCVTGVISTLTSSYSRISLWGHDGWHMGLIVQVAMIICCVMASDLFAGGDRRLLAVLLWTVFIIATIAFILGVINRFSIYPFRMWGQAEDFISTLGNINWFCGYWCVWTGAGCGLYLYARTGVTRVILSIYIWICAVTGICCGASSCYLAWGIMSLAALLWALSDSAGLMRLCDMEILMFAALPTVRFIGALRPNRMWYDSSLLRGLSYGDMWMKPFIIGVVVFSVLKEIFRRRERNRAWLRPVIAGITGGGTVAAVLMIMLNSTIEGGIWPVRGMSIFTWGISWGNSRGGIWMISLELIRRLLPFRIFFGVGCDCMCSFAYSMEDMVITLNRYIGRVYLTNAHNELLSMIINEGIAGAVAYFGVQFSSLGRCIHGLEVTGTEPAADPDPLYGGILLGAVLALAGYMTIGMVGFMQILSTPFMFMVMGMAMGLIKRKNKNIM